LVESDVRYIGKPWLRQSSATRNNKCALKTDHLRKFGDIPYLQRLEEHGV
jgi:hypothetical protein